MPPCVYVYCPPYFAPTHAFAEPKSENVEESVVAEAEGPVVEDAQSPGRLAYKSTHDGSAGGNTGSSVSGGGVDTGTGMGGLT